MKVDDKCQPFHRNGTKRVTLPQGFHAIPIICLAWLLAGLSTGCTSLRTPLKVQRNGFLTADEYTLLDSVANNSRPVPTWQKAQQDGFHPAPASVFAMANPQAFRKSTSISVALPVAVATNSQQFAVKFQERLAKSAKGRLRSKHLVSESSEAELILETAITRYEPKPKALGVQPDNVSVIQIEGRFRSGVETVCVFQIAGAKMHESKVLYLLTSGLIGLLAAQISDAIVGDMAKAAVQEFDHLFTELDKGRLTGARMSMAHLKSETPP